MSNTITLLSETSETTTGEKYKGDGYYGRADGLHTVQWSLNTFLGSIKLQGSISVDPQPIDWFDIKFNINETYSIDTTGKIIRSELAAAEFVYSAMTSGVFIYNFTGNYVWVRAVANRSAGTVNNIKMIS
jgi:hypothetical protein